MMFVTYNLVFVFCKAKKLDSFREPVWHFFPVGFSPFWLVRMFRLPYDNVPELPNLPGSDLANRRM
jgi:hypothetical protein